MDQDHRRRGVVLFRPAYSRENVSTPTVPWALLYVAAPLVERGVDVTLVDEAATPDYEVRLHELLSGNDAPIAVGISSMTGLQIANGLRFARLVRDRCASPVVWGGIHPTLLPEQTASHHLVDFVVAGEGEEAFADLVRRLSTGDDTLGIPGVFQMRDGEVRGERREGFIDFSSVPALPYHLLDMDRYICARPDLGARRFSELCTSRGCVHRCGFCYVGAVHGRCWRPLEAADVVDRLKAHVERFDLDCVMFREDNFFVRRKRVEDICKGILDAGLRIKWSGNCRINYFANYTPEFVDLLRRSGCVNLTFGVESGSDRVLDFIGKDITVDMVRRATNMLKTAGIRSSYHFMGGFPTETEEEFLETCSLVDEVLNIFPGMEIRELAVLTPYPGLDLLPHCVSGGFTPPDSLEGWIDFDWWRGPSRPWLTKSHVRLLDMAQFLIARVCHANPLVRRWARARLRRMIARKGGMNLFERRVIELVRRVLR